MSEWSRGVVLVGVVGWSKDVKKNVNKIVVKKNEIWWKFVVFELSL